MVWKCSKIDYIVYIWFSKCINYPGFIVECVITLAKVKPSTTFIEATFILKLTDLTKHQHFVYEIQLLIHQLHINFQRQFAHRYTVVRVRLTVMLWRRIVELGCCRVPPGYSVYQSPYLSAAAAAATPGVVSLQPGGISHAALAAAAAATSQFYEYQNAAAAAAAAAAVSYPSQAYANGFETYPYTTAAGMFSLLMTTWGVFTYVTRLNKLKIIIVFALIKNCFNTK